MSIESFYIRPLSPALGDQARVAPGACLRVPPHLLHLRWVGKSQGPLGEGRGLRHQLGDREQVRQAENVFPVCSLSFEGRKFPGFLVSILFHMDSVTSTP